MTQYLIFGETIWDVYPDRSVIGGAPFNFAANLALLGADAYLVTGLGRDRLGEDAARVMREYGIRGDYVQENDKPTGQCIVTLKADGVPEYRVLEDVAYDHVAFDDETIERIRRARFDVFYFNTLAQRHPVSRASIARILDEVDFPTVFCDVNIRPGCWDRDSLALCLSRATVVKISEEEAHFIAEAGLVDGSLPFEKALSEAFPNLSLLIYTMGKKGSAAYDFKNGAAVFSGEPERVPVVSTVGAGDCFGASFLFALNRGDGIEGAIRFATERSNVVVSNTEAIPAAFVEERKASL